MKDCIGWVKGKSARAFVRFAAKYLAREIYRGVLGREANAEELSSCAGAIRSTGEIASQVRKQVISAELRNKNFDAETPGLITSVYQTFLERDPDPKGLEDHKSWFARNRDIPDFLRLIATCEEFKAKYRKGFIAPAHRKIEPNP